MIGAGASSLETVVVVGPVVKKFCQSELLQSCPPPLISVSRHSDRGARHHLHQRPVRRLAVVGPPVPGVAGGAGGEEWEEEVGGG